VRKQLEITTVVPCPLQCEYCPQGLLYAWYEGTPELTLDDFKYFVGKVPTDVRIHFSGMAEPWANPACTEMVEYAVQTHEVQVYTTTAGMSFEDAERIARLPFSCFVIHLPDDTPTCRVPYQPAILEILAPVITGRMTVGTPRRDVPRGGVHQAERIVRAGLLQTPSRQGPLHCRWGRCEQNVLLPNGDVVLCCMDYGMEHWLGNLRRESYESLEVIRKQVLACLSTDSEPVICRHCCYAECGPPQ
jgi:sulfatase maturation enzyme AslB (radical SAM superfamily)